MINTFRREPHLELEARLGKIHEGRDFRAGMSESYSRKLHSDMTDASTYGVWKNVHPLRNFEYKYFPNDVRARYEVGVPTEFHRVVRRAFFVVVCLKRSCAIKFALKEEIPLPADTQTLEPFSHIRLNSRASLEMSGWRYDFTKVGEGKAKEQACERLSYQIELEMLKSESTKTDHQLAVQFLGLTRDLLGRYDDYGRPDDLHLSKI